jgi:hypothetical protein
MCQLCKICSQYKETAWVWASYKCTTCILQLQLQCAPLQESAYKSVATCVRESVTDGEQAFDDTISDHKNFSVRVARSQVTESWNQNACRKVSNR